MVDSVAFNAAYKQALAAYNNAANNADDAAASGSGGFTGFMVDELKKLNNSLRKAENTSSQSVTGQADINDLVTSVGEAELALQTVIAIRDRAISAYQDIIKMPI